MHDKFYLIHTINNPKGMVRGDGGFTEGMLFVIFFRQGGYHPPASPLNSIPGDTRLYFHISDSVLAFLGEFD